MNKAQQGAGQNPATRTDLTTELLQAVLTATDEQKRAALRVLRGEAEQEMQMKPVEPFLTLKEVAQRLNVSTTTLWRWHLPGHDLYGRRRFRMTEIQTHLDKVESRDRAQC